MTVTNSKIPRTHFLNEDAIRNNSRIILNSKIFCARSNLFVFQFDALINYNVLLFL